MSTIRQIFRHATRLAVAGAVLLGALTAAPAAFASVPPPPGNGDSSSTTAAPAIVHTVTVGGTPGWQIALFVAAAAVIAAVVAVLLDRMRAGRGRELATTAH
jgi:hypothetical protein